MAAQRDVRGGRPRCNAAMEQAPAIILSAGGERAIPWEVGVLAGLRDAGVALDRSPLVAGTSAGALVAAQLTTGTDPRLAAGRLATAEPVEVPEVVRGAVARALPVLVRASREGGAAEAARIAGEMPGVIPHELFRARHEQRIAAAAPWPEALVVLAFDVGTGERVAIDASWGVDVVDAVCAARAIPGLVDPYPLAGRRLIDAAIGSGTNADVAAGHGAVVITSAPRRPAPHSFEALWNAALATELEVLGDAAVIHASVAARAAMGDDLMSAAGARRSLAIGRLQGQAGVERRAA
jgi:NTE family protein